MLIHKAQAFALPRRQKLNRIHRRVLGFTHSVRSKGRLASFVYFVGSLAARKFYPWLSIKPWPTWGLGPRGLCAVQRRSRLTPR